MDEEKAIAPDGSIAHNVEGLLLLLAELKANMTYLKEWPLTIEQFREISTALWDVRQEWLNVFPPDLGLRGRQ